MGSIWIIDARTGEEAWKVRRIGFAVAEPRALVRRGSCVCGATWRRYGERYEYETAGSMKDERKRVALVTCQAYANLYEDDHLLVAALPDIGIASEPAARSDASI